MFLAGTIHVRVKKMEDAGYPGIFSEYRLWEIGLPFYRVYRYPAYKVNRTQEVLKELAKIPNVVEASVISGKYNIFIKIRAKNTDDAKAHYLSNR